LNLRFLLGIIVIGLLLYWLLDDPTGLAVLIRSAWDILLHVFSQVAIFLKTLFGGGR